MTADEFRLTLAHPEPPDVSPLLQALWYDARGDWDRAHRIAQDLATPEAAWVHAYLHRREGDRGNARYWYHRAGRREATGAVDLEWRHLVDAFLQRS